MPRVSIPAVFDTDDVTISGVTVTRSETLHDGIVRYFYDGQSLAQGEVNVTLVADEVADVLGNANAEAADQFVYQPPNNDPLRVERFVINDGDAQRSNIELITVFFNQETNLQDLIDDGTIVTAVELFGAAIDLTADRFQYDAAQNALLIDITDDGFGGSASTSLEDGRYQLRLDTQWITDPAGNRLVDDDAIDDAIRTFDFHRLLTDWDGDGDGGTGRDRTPVLGPLRLNVAGSETLRLRLRHRRGRGRRSKLTTPQWRAPRRSFRFSWKRSPGSFSAGGAHRLGTEYNCVPFIPYSDQQSVPHRCPKSTV